MEGWFFRWIEGTKVVLHWMLTPEEDGLESSEAKEEENAGEAWFL